MKRTLIASLCAALIVLGASALLAGPASAGEEDGLPIPNKGWTIIADEPEEPELTPDDYFRMGEESYEFGEYDQAMANFEAALDGLEDPIKRAKCFERLAFVYAAFGMNDEVYDAFAESLSLDSSLVLDPDIVSPKVYEFYIRARNDVVREGALVVNTDPPGASVYLDGEPIGEAPVKLEHVNEGEYILDVMKRGYETSSGPVVIKKDVTLTVDEKLAPARGTLRVASIPPGVSITLDGEPAGVTPAVLDNVRGGLHTIKLSRENFEDYTDEFEMDKSTEYEHSALMTRRLLVITSDGVETGAARALVERGLSSIPGLSPIFTDTRSLCEDLASRGLPEDSAGFAASCKMRLELGETAVISGIMENARTELALVVSHSRAALDDGSPAERLDIALYGTASELADVTGVTAPDRKDLSAAVDRFRKAWGAVMDTEELTFGIGTLDRASGTVEVLSVLPGYPAQTAGVTPGMTIRSVDGTPVTDTATLKRLTQGTGPREFEFVLNNKPHKATLEPVRTGTEAPLDSGVYLYNLGLVDLSAYVDATVEEAKSGPDSAGRELSGDFFGLRALSLGNVYRHFGMTDKAIKVYSLVRTTNTSGVCAGTALYRLAEAYEDKGMWTQAADSYRTAMLMYPDATMDSSNGPRIASASTERLKRLYRLGLIRERWWL